MGGPTGVALQAGDPARPKAWRLKKKKKAEGVQGTVWQEMGVEGLAGLA